MVSYKYNSDNYLSIEKKKKKLKSSNRCKNYFQIN